MVRVPEVLYQILTNIMGIKMVYQLPALFPSSKNQFSAVVVINQMLKEEEKRFNGRVICILRQSGGNSGPTDSGDLFVDQYRYSHIPYWPIILGSLIVTH